MEFVWLEFAATVFELDILHIHVLLGILWVSHNVLSLVILLCSQGIRNFLVSDGLNVLDGNEMISHDILFHPCVLYLPFVYL